MDAMYMNNILYMNKVRGSSCIVRVEMRRNIFQVKFLCPEMT